MRKPKMDLTLNYFVIPLVLIILLYFFVPTLYSKAVTRILFPITGILGFFVVYYGAVRFLKDGKTRRYALALSFMVLSVFSLFSSLGFAIDDISMVGWLVQIGTLMASVMFLVASLMPEKTVSASGRMRHAFLYALYAVTLSGVIVVLTMASSDHLPMIYDAKEGWGAGVFPVRMLSSVFFLMAGTFLHARGTYEAGAASLLLLSAGSIGVSLVYLLNVASNSLITFNRGATIIAMLIFLLGIRLKK